MSLSQIQKSVAASSGELLDITRKIDDLVRVYTTADIFVVDLKRRVIQAQCYRLRENLEKWKKELEECLNETGLSEERQFSVSLTKQLIDQNFAILIEKEMLLAKIEEHVAYIQGQHKINRALEAEIEMQNIRQKLKKMLEPMEGGGHEE